MKKIFDNPEIEIMILGAKDDIITTSEANGIEDHNQGDTGGPNETPDW